MATETQFVTGPQVRTVSPLPAMIRPFTMLCYAVVLFLGSSCRSEQPQPDHPAMSNAASFPTMPVLRTTDFPITGDGSNPAWQTAEWVALQRRAGSAHSYSAQVKMLYSETGLYVLFDGSDTRLTATMVGENLHIWEEDVYEVFLWTDERYPIYFEYEISPLNQELVLLVPNFGGEFLGWIPWDYEGERRIRKEVSVRDGVMESGSSASGWSAEVFIPYALLRPLQNVPPQPGMRWRANFYRNDYDDGGSSSWAWSPTTGNYHLIEQFGTLLFE